MHKRTCFFTAAFQTVKETPKSLPLAGEGAQCSHWADEAESHWFCTAYPEITTFQAVTKQHFDANISTDGNLFSNELSFLQAEIPALAGCL